MYDDSEERQRKKQVDYALVRDARIECREWSPDCEMKRNVCSKSKLCEQMKDVTVKFKPRDDDDDDEDRCKDCKLKPNQKEKKKCVDSVTGCWEE